MDVRYKDPEAETTDDGNIISVTEAQRIGRRKEDETREVTHTKALLETKQGGQNRKNVQFC